MLLAKNNCDNLEALSCVSSAYFVLKQYDRHFEYQLFRHRCLILPPDESLYLFDHLIKINDTDSAIQVATTYGIDNTTLLAQFRSSLHDLKCDDMLSLPLFSPESVSQVQEESHPSDIMAAIHTPAQEEPVEVGNKIDDESDSDSDSDIARTISVEEMPAFASQDDAIPQQEEQAAEESTLTQLLVDASTLLDNFHGSQHQAEEVDDDNSVVKVEQTVETISPEPDENVVDVVTISDNISEVVVESYEAEEIFAAVVDNVNIESLAEAAGVAVVDVVAPEGVLLPGGKTDQQVVSVTEEPEVAQAVDDAPIPITTTVDSTSEVIIVASTSTESTNDAETVILLAKASLEANNTTVSKQEQVAMELVQPQLTEVEQRQIRMANTYINIAQTYYLKEDFPACLKQLTLALKKCSWAPEALLLRGMTNIKLATLNNNPSLLNDAVLDLNQVYTKYVHVNTTLSAAAKGWLTQLASLHLRQGNVKPTIDIFSLMLEQEGKLELEAYWQLAVAYEKQQNWTFAVHTLQKLEQEVSANSNDSSGQMSEIQAYWLRNVLPKIGKLAEQSGDFTTAQAYYQRSIEMKFVPSNSIAEMYIRHNQSTLAIGYYQQALDNALSEHERSNNTLKTTASTLQIGQLYRRLGDIYASMNSSVEAHEQALFHYQQAMTYGVDDKAIRRYLATHLSASTLPATLSLKSGANVTSLEQQKSQNETVATGETSDEAVEEEPRPKKAFSGGSRWVVKRAIQPTLDDEYADYYDDAQQQQRSSSRLASGGGGSSALEAALMQNMQKQLAANGDDEDEYGTATGGVDGRSGNSFFEQYQQLEQRQKAEEEAEKRKRHQSLMMD